MAHSRAQHSLINEIRTSCLCQLAAAAEGVVIPKLQEDHLLWYDLIQL